MSKQIAKKDLSAANQRFDTQRARYLYLTKLGHSQALHAAAAPREQGKLERYRVKCRIRKD